MEPKKEKGILDYETVDIDLIKKELVIIDQTKLPEKIEIIRLTTAKDIWDAIYLLKVRGAPAIGVAAAIGLYVLADRIQADTYGDFLEAIEEQAKYLDSSRPTAVNLHWGLKRMLGVAREETKININNSLPFSLGRNIILSALEKEAVEIKQEDIAVSRKIGEYGLSLISDGDRLLTHCNAGKLAAIQYGTATAPMYLAKEKGYNIKVYVDETRPLLQGSRLTAFELSSAGIDVTLVCDNMCYSIMQQGLDCIFVGCDRVAANGDTANKIGTGTLAVVAKHFSVPFYVCAPTSTIDLDTENGSGIVIEERKPEEVTDMWFETSMAPNNINVYNPAFDVTAGNLISGIITEYGIIYPPYKENIKKTIENHKNKSLY